MKNNNFLTTHFRKENGVCFFLTEMEYLLREGDMALASFSFLFLEIYDYDTGNY